MTEFTNVTSTTTAVGTDAMGVEDSSTLKLLLRSMPDEKGEQRTFEIPYAAAKLSELIVDATGDHDQEEEDEDGGDGTTNTATTTPMEIDISRVKGGCLEKVVAFLIHYHEEPMKPIPTPLGGGSFNEVMDQVWYQEFVSDASLGNRDMLFDLLTAANFMGIKELLDLACLKVTFELTGKNAEQIRQILRLPKLSPEEEAQAREDHKWIFEDA